MLKAGLPPVQGRKLVYWREKAFTRRILPPPAVEPHSGVASSGSVPAAPPLARTLPPDSRKGPDMSDLTLDLVIPALEAAGIEPLPDEGASPEQVEAWVERFIDASAQPKMQEAGHGR